MKKMKFGRLEEAVAEVPPGAVPGSGSHVNLREATPSGGRNNARLFATTARAQSSSSDEGSAKSNGTAIAIALVAAAIGAVSYLYQSGSEDNDLQEEARRNAVSDDVRAYLLLSCSVANDDAAI